MINKVLAIILYISGLFDSKSIVKEVVWRKQQNKGGAFINPRWGLFALAASRIGLTPVVQLLGRVPDAPPAVRVISDAYVDR